MMVCASLPFENALLAVHPTASCGLKTLSISAIQRPLRSLRDCKIIAVIMGQCAYACMEAELAGQVLIWSSRSRSCVYNAYVTAMRATKQVNENAIKELACTFARDLYQALR